MNTIATTFPDIPRIYTGIAEWASCLLFMCFLPRKRSNAMTAVIAAAFLLAQCLFLVVTAEVPLFLWIPCMLAAFGLMLSFLALCIEYPLHICLYYALLSLVTAETSWQNEPWPDSCDHGCHIRADPGSDRLDRAKDA